MLDSCGRIIDYLRISLTDRCNFRCRYCMPPEGVKLLAHQEILSYEEILRVISILGVHGIDKIRLTGGEPLVRKGIVDFVARVKSLGIVKDLSLTTNGSLLSKYVRELKAAGLDRVNISIDTSNPERFHHITGGGELAETLTGIMGALDVGLLPVKLNVVLTEVLSAEDIVFFVKLIHKYPLSVRFIEYMPIGCSGVKPGFSVSEVKSLINQSGHGMLMPNTLVRGNGPASYYGLPEAKGTIGFITPLSEHFCPACSRIRLTADGKCKSCLLGDQEIDIRTALRNGADDQQIYNLFVKAVQQKPLRHHLGENGQTQTFARRMVQIGG